MRIIAFSSVDLPDPSPTAQRLLHMCAGVARSGGEVTLHVRQGGPPPDPACLEFYGLARRLGTTPLEVRELPGRWGWPFFSQKLDRIFKPMAGQPFCVYLSDITPWAPKLIERARAAGGRVIFEPSPQAAGPPPAAGLKEEILKRADGLVCTRKKTLDALRPDLRPGTPATVLGPGTWTAPAVSAGTGPRDIDVLYCGPADPGSGIDLVVAAMQTLIPHTLTIAGPIPDRDQGRLQQAALAVGAIERVKFVTDVPPGRMWDLYERCKVGILPLHDPGPEKMALMDPPHHLLEMMAAGVPVLANRLEMLADFATDGREVLLVGEDTPRAYAEGLRKLLRDEELRVRLGAAARARVADFGWEGRGARLIAFAQEVLK